MVRPVELTTLFATIVADTDKPATIQAYNNHIFASMGKAWVADDMSKALQSWFDDVIGMRLGLHDYRHLGIAIQRRFMDLSERKPTENELALNRLRGHEKAVADDHYARETYLGSCSPDERGRALALGGEYHKVMGFSTGFNDKPTAEAQKLREDFYYTSTAIPLPTKKLGRRKESKQKAESKIPPPPLPPATPKKRKATAVKLQALTTSVAEPQTQPLFLNAEAVVRRSSRLRKPSAKTIETAETSAFEDSD